MRETFFLLSCNNRPKIQRQKTPLPSSTIHTKSRIPSPTKVSQWFFSSLYLSVCLPDIAIVRFLLFFFSLPLLVSLFCETQSYCLSFSPLLSIISFSSPMIDRVCCKFSFLCYPVWISLPLILLNYISASQNKTIRSLPDIFYLFVCVNLSHKTRGERDCHGCHRLLSSLVMSLSWLKCLDQNSLFMLILFCIHSQCE